MKTIEMTALAAITGGATETGTQDSTKPVWHTIPADPGTDDTFTIPDLMPETKPQTTKPEWHTIPADPGTDDTFTIPDLLS